MTDPGSNHARFTNSEPRTGKRPRHSGRRAVERLSTLLRVSEELAELASVEDERKAYEIVANEASRQCRCLAVIRRYDPMSDELVLVVSAGEIRVLPFLRIPADDGLSGQVYATRRAARIDDLHDPASNAVNARVSDQATRSLMVNPISLDDVYYGSLGLSHSDPHHFDDDDSEFVNGLGRLLAATLHRFHSARREAELLERKRHEDIVASVGDLALHFAHRIGNDLGIVRSRIRFAKQALNRDNQKSVERDLDIIEESVQGVLDLASMFRRNTADLGRHEPTMLSMADLVHSLGPLRNPPDGCNVRIQIPTDLPLVRAVPEHIRTIIESLADNAFQAMPDGGTLTIGGRSTDRTVKIEIHDTGTGIRPEDRPHIFNFGYSTKGSSGYGLWHAQQVARANGGEMYLASSGETGTEFVLALPRDTSREGASDDKP